jgi:hypothetical protein
LEEFIVSAIEIEDKLCQFIAEFGDDLCSLELLLFFGRHPNARFNRTAVIHARNGRQFETRMALQKLLVKKIVIIHSENGIPLYGLTGNKGTRDIVFDLVNIDQRQWQSILQNILAAQGIT